MRPKTIVRRRKADDDIEATIGYYLSEAGAEIATDFVDRLEEALSKVARRPATGSPRYGHQLSIPGMRHLPVQRFPYLIFYLERETHIEVTRVLHNRMDIPSWIDDDA